MINCLMVSGQSLTDDIRQALLETARKMVKAGSKKRRFSLKGFEGRVTTKYEHHSVGNLRGMHFEATVESERMKTKVSFLVRQVDLDEGDEYFWHEARVRLNRYDLN